MASVRIRRTAVPRRIRITRTVPSSVPVTGEQIKSVPSTSHDQRTSFFHVHAHSSYSIGDALPSPKHMVATVVAHGQPALALTDHGSMAGTVQLYQECRKAGILPFPGIEAYVVRDHADTKAKRYHMGILALDLDGYEALVKLTTRSYTRPHFHHKPRVDLADFAEWYEHGWTRGLAITTGCYFGLVTQTLITQGPDAAKRLVSVLAKWFPHTFVELQNHHIDHGDGYDDASVAAALFDIATELGLPVVLGQDAHYCNAADKPVHETLKRLVAFGDDPDDAVFPGDGFHLSDAAWVRAHHEERHWVQGEQGFAHLLALHSLTIPELDTYNYAIPTTVSSPQEVLVQRCEEMLAAKKLGPAYRERLHDELDNVACTGMAGYLLLVQEVTDWCRANGVFYQIRGSAAGSLICWMLNITQIDPLKHHLRSDRFISRDRTKPPDIDIDVEDTRRAELIAFLKSRFAVCQIGTYAEYGIRVRVQDPDTGEWITPKNEGRGSLLVAWMRVLAKSGVDTSTIHKLADLDPAHQSEIRALADAHAKKSAGTHAAGLILTSTAEAFDRLVPKLLIPGSGDADSIVSQYEMGDVEALGLVKLDVLGLRTLSLLRRATELIGRSVLDGLDYIPLDDARTYTTIRNGATAGVFQLEGWTAQRGCKEVQVRSLTDVIHIMALYRPAVLDRGMEKVYLRRKFGREQTPKRHELLYDVLKDTYGIPVFQDQVITILREIGLSGEDLTELLKAVKASQRSEIAEAKRKIASYTEMVFEHCSGMGISYDDATFLWEAVEGFAEYGFGLAHATVYGITAVRCAYLKTHHRLEFAAALLETSAGKAKEDDYKKAVHEMGIRLLPPDVNISTHTYTLDRERKAIRRGLASIKGIGMKAASEIAANAPYSSLEDLIARTNSRLVTGGRDYAKSGELCGVLEKLRDNRALRSVLAGE